MSRESTPGEANDKCIKCTQRHGFDTSGKLAVHKLAKSRKNMQETRVFYYLAFLRPLVEGGLRIVLIGKSYLARTLAIKSWISKRRAILETLRALTSCNIARMRIRQSFTRRSWAHSTIPFPDYQASPSWSVEHSSKALVTQLIKFMHVYQPLESNL